jgi:CrcB protein
VTQRQERQVSDESDKKVTDALHVPTRRQRFGRRAAPSVLMTIAIGGGLGTLGRYGISRVIHVSPDTFPWATFVTNLSGAFMIGVFLALILERSQPTRFARPFFAIGVLGGYTTYSTMAVETVTLCKDGYPVLGIGYLLASVFAGLACCYLGMVLARVTPLGGVTAPR